MGDGWWWIVDEIKYMQRIDDKLVFQYFDYFDDRLAALAWI